MFYIIGEREKKRKKKSFYHANVDIEKNSSETIYMEIQKYIAGRNCNCPVFSEAFYVR